jgi:cytochrome c peroxidase
VEVVAGDADYRRSYEAVFGAFPEVIAAGGEASAAVSGVRPYATEWQRMPEAARRASTRIFVNLGKALAAYQRLLLPGPSRFDHYAAAVLGETGDDPDALFAPTERRGLRLFIGRGQCTKCHNGPLFTNNAFHNSGSLSAPGQLPSRGRSEGALLVRDDPLNCLGQFSDDDQRRCPELQFMKTGDEFVGAHRTPSLRSVSQTGPYMHAGQLQSLEAVVEQYDRARDAMIGHNEAKPLGLSARDRSDLIAFLRSLDGSIDVEPGWLAPPGNR